MCVCVCVCVCVSAEAHTHQVLKSIALLLYWLLQHTDTGAAAGITTF